MKFFTSLSVILSSILFIVSGCGKCPCPPVPIPPVPVPSTEFRLEGKTVTMDVKLVPGTKLTLEEAKRQLGVGLAILDTAN